MITVFQMISIAGFSKARCLEDLLRPQLIAAMYYIYLAGEPAEVEGVLQGGISPADNGHLLVF